MTAESGEYYAILITETESISIPNFNNPYRKDRQTDAHGGVTIYTRSNQISKHRTDLDIKDLEATWCEIMIGTKRNLIGAMYRPPNADIRYCSLIEESSELAKSTDIHHIRTRMAIHQN